MSDKDLLQKHNFKFQKKYGQNFLYDPKIPARIAENCTEGEFPESGKKDEVIVEVGPGAGILTKELAKRFRSVSAVEIDENLIKIEIIDYSAKNIDYIVHLAGAMPAHMANYDPYEYLNSVIVGTLNVLEYARENHCKKIIFSQSIADILHLFGTQHPILDDVVREFPLKGDHAVYSISKNTAVNLIEHYYAEYGIKRYILRLPTIYHYHPNPYYYVNGEKKWLAYRYIIDQASKGMPLQIWGNPNATKEMVYIKDLTHLIECCILSNVDGGIYNVGCGHPLSIEEQIKQIQSRLDDLEDDRK